MALRRDAAGNRAVVGNGDRALAAGGGRDRRHFVRSGQCDFDIGAKRNATTDCEERHRKQRFLEAHHDFLLTIHCPWNEALRFLWRATPDGYIRA